MKEQHNLHCDFLPSTRHRKNNVVLYNISQSKIAPSSHWEVDQEQNWTKHTFNRIISNVVLNLLPMARVAEIGNLPLSFISAWIVGNVDAPANANIIDPKANNVMSNSRFYHFIKLPLKNPSAEGAGYVIFSISVPRRIHLMTMRRQATQVVIRAPTAMGQKSLGLPIQVRGVRQPAVTTIHWHRVRWRPTPANRDINIWEMRTMKTQPPPYSVKVMENTDRILPHLPTAFSPIAGYGSLTWPLNSSYLSSSMIQQRPNLVPVNPELMVNIKIRMRPSQPKLQF